MRKTPGMGKDEQATRRRVHRVYRAASIHELEIVTRNGWRLDEGQTPFIQEVEKWSNDRRPIQHFLVWMPSDELDEIERLRHQLAEANRYTTRLQVAIANNWPAMESAFALGGMEAVQAALDKLTGDPVEQGDSAY